MRTLFRLLIVLPLAILIVLFAVANRHLVMVSFDPFPGNDIQGPQLTAPLFLLLFLAGSVGVLAGGMSRSGFVCSISSMKTPASDRYVISFHGGATWQAGDSMKIMGAHAPMAHALATTAP